MFQSPDFILLVSVVAIVMFLMLIFRKDVTSGFSDLVLKRIEPHLDPGEELIEFILCYDDATWVQRQAGFWLTHLLDLVKKVHTIALTNRRMIIVRTTMLYSAIALHSELTDSIPISDLTRIEYKEGGTFGGDITFFLRERQLEFTVAVGPWTFRAKMMAERYR